MNESSLNTVDSTLPSSYSPKVTVITATYNSASYLEECILSILRQSYRNFEYLIIDGGSTDGTVEIIKQYEDKLAYWVSEPDKGIYDAWNKGLIASTGDWITFVGSDDVLHPDALHTYIKHISQHPRQCELEFVSSRIELVNQNLLPIRVVGQAWTWELFRKEMATWHVGSFHSKQLFSKYGVYDPDYKISGDYELLLRAKEKLVTSFIDKVTAKMRTGGVSNNRLFKAIDETYRAKIKNKVFSKRKGELLKIIDILRLFTRKLTK